MQLIRLGDASNFSHGRTSASTLDDGFSGAADASSSTGATSDGEDFSDDDVDDGWNATKAELDDDGALGPKGKKLKTTTAAAAPRQSIARSRNNGKASSGRKPSSKPAAIASKKLAMVTQRVPHQHHQLAADEEDLSTKPRCQRCRKSKKGCDRQRPCGRCRDAGIGIDGCVSEDEGNGRKGRYGRHMGVPVKKALEMGTADDEMQEVGVDFMSSTGDNSKKRKR